MSGEGQSKTQHVPSYVMKLIDLNGQQKGEIVLNFCARQGPQDS